MLPEKNNRKYCLLRDAIIVRSTCICKAPFIHSAERIATHPWASFLSTYQIIYYYQHNCRWFRLCRCAMIIFPLACNRIAGSFVQCHCGFVSPDWPYNCELRKHCCSIRYIYIFSSVFFLVYSSFLLRSCTSSVLLATIWRRKIFMFYADEVLQLRTELTMEWITSNAGEPREQRINKAHTHSLRKHPQSEIEKSWTWRDFVSLRLRRME